MQNILWIILIFFIGVICGATILWVAIYKKYIIIDIDINNDMINKIHQYTQSPIIRKKIFAKIQKINKSQSSENIHINMHIPSSELYISS
jgi:uncharacterized protein YneF (UPF0154 family)